MNEAGMDAGRDGQGWQPAIIIDAHGTMAEARPLIGKRVRVRPVGEDSFLAHKCHRIGRFFQVHEEDVRDSGIADDWDSFGFCEHEVLTD